MLSLAWTSSSMRNLLACVAAAADSSGSAAAALGASALSAPSLPPPSAPSPLVVSEGCGADDTLCSMAPAVSPPSAGPLMLRAAGSVKTLMEALEGNAGKKD